VIANGCSDNTAEIATNLSKEIPQIRVVELTVGDKCNAWNHFVHELKPRAACYAFMDGDVQPAQERFTLSFRHCAMTLRAMQLQHFRALGAARTNCVIR
jgi:hypothetical protein